MTTARRLNDLRLKNEYSARHKINTLITNEDLVYNDSVEVDDNNLKPFNSTLRLNRSGDSTKPFSSSNTSGSSDPDQGHVATMKSAEFTK